jgi:hypothetical protein
MGFAMALQVNQTLQTHGLNAKIIAYFKDEDNSLPTMIIALVFVVFYEVLGLVEPFTRNLWGHAMSKCCQYATYDTKVFVGLMLIYFVKDDYLDQKKWDGTTRMEKILVGYWHMSMQVRNYNQRTICLKGQFIPINIGIKKSNCLLLCTTTIYGISKVCSKFISLGSSPNSF